MKRTITVNLRSVMTVELMINPYTDEFASPAEVWLCSEKIGSTPFYLSDVEVAKSIHQRIVEAIEKNESTLTFDL